MKSYFSLLSLSISFILLIASCESQDEIQIPDPMDEMEETVPVSYLALGDSYTIGQGVSEFLRWPVQLSQLLSDEDCEVNKTDIIAKTGWKTSDLISAIDQNNTDGYNLVSLLIGVNNQFNNQSFAIFQSEFDVLLKTAIEIAGSKDRVFLLSIPDYGVTPFGSSNAEQIAEDLDKYNSYMEDICIDQGILFIDITEISRELADSPGSLAPDNLHPSGSQYTAWANKALPMVKEMLTE